MTMMREHGVLLLVLLSDVCIRSTGRHVNNSINSVENSRMNFLDKMRSHKLLHRFPVITEFELSECRVTVIILRTIAIAV